MTGGHLGILADALEYACQEKCCVAFETTEHGDMRVTVKSCRGGQVSEIYTHHTDECLAGTVNRLTDQVCPPQMKSNVIPLKP